MPGGSRPESSWHHPASAAGGLPGRGNIQTPALRWCYDVPDWHNAIAHQDHHIYYCYAIYSAPDSACPSGTKLEVRGDSKLVKIYWNGELVKVHLRQPCGGRYTDPEDYPQELTAYTLRSPNYLRQQSAELGERHRRLRR